MYEVDTEKWKTIVDRVDALGVASVAFTGGEPLLRHDIFEIIDYIKSKELFVKLTSNGVLPIKRYERLLQTKIDNISISLDGIEGDNLPYSKVSPKIIDVIRYLYSHKGSKEFFISTLLTQRNQNDLPQLVEFINSNFPGLSIFVQPVVVGQGKLRCDTEKKVDVTVLRNFKSLLNPAQYNLDCQRYYLSENYRWGCRGGRLFFDIKSNGDFWVCQDVPTKLNILDDNFFQKWRNYDFTQLTRNCSGCIYSCYFLTQKGFEFRYWLDLIKKYILLKSSRRTVPVDCEQQ